MESNLHDDFDGLPLPAIRKVYIPTVADQVFEALQQRILTLGLPPGKKISEADVARSMDVSRQPVRDAFKRLEKLGFLRIRPQSGTTVTLISEDAIQRARFIRTALEVHTCRAACDVITKDGLEALASLIAEQREAIDARERDRFHTLDDAFHLEICRQAGVEYVWDLIHDCKAHMDRIRLLSLTHSSQQFALEGHIALYDAIARQDPNGATAAITRHLDRILVLVEEVKSRNHRWFEETDA